MRNWKMIDTCTNMQKFIHLCDYLASRKQIGINFDVSGEIMRCTCPKRQYAPCNRLPPRRDVCPEYRRVCCEECKWYKVDTNEN